MSTSTTNELTLQDLILTLKGDRTYLGLEEASGGVVKAQRWNQIANNLRVNEFPEPRTIEAMARALNVEVEVLVLAFARAVGLHVPHRRSLFAELLPPMVDSLTTRQRDAVLGVIRAMNDREEEERDDNPEAAPPQPPKSEPPPKRRRKAPRFRDMAPRDDMPPLG